MSNAEHSIRDGNWRMILQEIMMDVIGVVTACEVEKMFFNYCQCYLRRMRHFKMFQGHSSWKRFCVLDIPWLGRVTCVTSDSDNSITTVLP